MPLDPLSALSVAASVVQFIDYGTKVVSKGKKLYKSLDGTLFENVELEAASCRLQSLSRNLLASLDPGQSDTALENICHSCDEISKLLVSRLEDLQLPEDLANPDHKTQRKWHSFRQALKTVWSKKEIDEMADRLARLRSELDTQVLISLREQMQVSSLKCDRQFKLLDRHIQQTITTLLKDRDALQDMVNQFKALNVWQEKEHEKTRNIFIAKAEQRLRRKVQLSILENLRFAAMKDRDETIAEAHQRTFEWIFHEPGSTEDTFLWSSFTKWLESDDGIYWIHGKPGSGKSTLMRFVASHELTRSCLDRWAKDGHVWISTFYFWNSGAIEQRSKAGMLRALLHNILKTDLELIPQVFPEQWEEHLKLIKHDAPIIFENHSIRKLQSSFTRLISQASEKLRFCFFIDGLDELEGDHEELASYFHQLSSSRFVKLCISSRPWLIFHENFKLRPSLRLQDLTASDIKLYIEEKLHSNNQMERLIRKNPEDAVKLVEEVVEKAQGVFLWVALVVKSLLLGLRQRDGIMYLRKRIQQIPADIQNLYGYLLLSIDPIYMEEASKVFQIYHAAELNKHQTDMDMEVVYHALTSELPCSLNEHDGVLSCQNPEFDSVYDHMDTILRSRCGGLLEIHGNEGRYYISYIHYTAKEYLTQLEVWDNIVSHTSMDNCNNFDPDLALLSSLISIFKQDVKNKETSVDIYSRWLRISFHAHMVQGYNSGHLVQLLDEFDQTATSQCHRQSSSSVRDDNFHWSNFQWSTLKTSFLFVACEAGLCMYVKAKFEDDFSKPTIHEADLLFQVFFLLEYSLFDYNILQVAEYLSGRTSPEEVIAGESIWSHWLKLMTHSRTAWSRSRTIFTVRRICKSMIGRGANVECWLKRLPDLESWKHQYKSCHDQTPLNAIEPLLPSRFDFALYSNHPSGSKCFSLESMVIQSFPPDEEQDEILKLIAKVKTAKISDGDSSSKLEKRKGARSQGSSSKMKKRRKI